VEYSFNLSGTATPASIRLDEYSFVYRRGLEEEVISYAGIVAVRINKSLDKTYRLHLYPDGRDPIMVTSHSSAVSPGTPDESREYALFVRVLHHHLKEKSHATFCVGSSNMRFRILLAVLSLGLFGAWAAAANGGIIVSISYLQAIIFTLVSGALFFVLGLKRLSKTYSPTDIPIQYLP
jgi:ribose/xylose/arabinose/galactoside ABC-type transport system permease subunit